MAPTNFVRIFRVLNEAEVRYVLVGGLAAVLHGVDRLTADIDLVIDLTPGEAEKAIRALTGAGLRANIPVDPLGFADPDTRRAWVADKGMRVLSFWDPAGGAPVVDLFAEHPVDFEGLWARAEVVDLGGVTCPLASREDLIAIKEAAGRDADRADAERLRDLQQGKEGDHDRSDD